MQFSEYLKKKEKTIVPKIAYPRDFGSDFLGVKNSQNPVL